MKYADALVSGKTLAAFLGMLLIALLGIAGSWAAETTNDIIELTKYQTDDKAETIQKITAVEIEMIKEIHALQLNVINSLDEHEDALVARIDKLLDKHNK